MSDEADFLGTGWSFPPTFSRRALAVEMVSGALDVRQSLRVLFSTWLGERVMLPTYGTAIWESVFDTLTTTLKTELADDVRSAILDWEPRVDVESVEVYEVPEEPGRVNIEVNYLLRHTNTRDNLVYPFYLQEGTLVPSLP